MTFFVGRGGAIDDLNEGITSCEVRQKRVSTASTCMRPWDKSGHIHKFDGDVPFVANAHSRPRNAQRALPSGKVVWCTTLVGHSCTKVTARAWLAGPWKRHTNVRVDGAEGIVGDVHLGKRARREERRLPHVGLANEADAQGSAPSLLLGGGGA